MEIQSVTFGILSEEEIIKNSVCLVNSSKRSGLGLVYDPRMGPLDTTGVCETCLEKMVKCPGHFGHIKLVEPILHPSFISRLPKGPAYKLNLVAGELTVNGVRTLPDDERFNLS